MEIDSRRLEAKQRGQLRTLAELDQYRSLKWGVWGNNKPILYKIFQVPAEVDVMFLHDQKCLQILKVGKIERDRYNTDTDGFRRNEVDYVDKIYPLFWFSNTQFYSELCEKSILTRIGDAYSAETCIDLDNKLLIEMTFYGHTVIPIESAYSQKIYDDELKLGVEK